VEEVSDVLVVDIDGWMGFARIIIGSRDNYHILGVFILIVIVHAGGCKGSGCYAHLLVDGVTGVTALA